MIFLLIFIFQWSQTCKLKRKKKEKNSRTKRTFFASSRQKQQFNYWTVFFIHARLVINLPCHWLLNTDFRTTWFFQVLPGSVSFLISVHFTFFFIPLDRRWNTVFKFWIPIEFNQHKNSLSTKNHLGINAII